MQLFAAPVRFFVVSYLFFLRKLNPQGVTFSYTNWLAAASLMRVWMTGIRQIALS